MGKEKSQFAFKKGQTVICIKRDKLTTDNINFMDVDNIKIGDKLKVYRFQKAGKSFYSVPTLQFENKNSNYYEHDATNFKLVNK